MTRLFIEASRVDKSSRQPQRDMSYAAIRSIAEAKPAPAAARLPRVYLKTPNAPGQRAFLRCAASFFLEIRQYSCEKMSCATQKSLAAGHIMSFQIHPNDLPAFMQQQIDDIRLIQERYAWFLDGIFAGKSFEKKKGQRKTSLAQQIEKKGLEPFVSGVSLGADSKVDAPKVNAQFCIRGTGREAEVVEKMYFDRLLDFVYVEFMKGLQKGFVPKRCANCGRWFLQKPGAAYKDVALAVQMGTYNGRSSSAMAPDSPITRQEAMTVVARALELDYDAYAKTDLSAFSDRSEISNWALPYVRAMVGADYIHGRGKVLAPLDNITRAEFAQIFYNIIGTYIVSKGTYDKDIKGSVLIRTDDVELKNLTVDGDLIIGCGAADGKITLDNVTVKGRLLVWGGGAKAVYCNAGTNMPAVVVARVDDAVKVIYDRDSTLAVIDTIKVRITERAKQHKETEVIFYDVSGLREAQKQLNAIVADNQIDITAPAHLYALVGAESVKAEFTNNSKSDTYKVEIRRSKDNALIADAFELAAGKSISTLKLLEASEFGNTDCIVTITAYRDGKQIGTLNTELTLHTAYLWPKEVQ